MSLNGRRHPKGDEHGKPIPANDQPAGGCPFAAAGAIAALIASIAAARAAQSRVRRGQLPRKV